MLEVHRASWKVAGDSSDDHGRAVSLGHAEGLNRVVILRASAGAPPFDRGRAGERAAFIVDDAVTQKASGESAGISGSFRREVRGDGLRQADQPEDCSSIGE